MGKVTSKCLRCEDEITQKESDENQGLCSGCYKLYKFKVAMKDRESYEN